MNIIQHWCIQIQLDIYIEPLQEEVIRGTLHASQNEASPDDDHSGIVTSASSEQGDNVLQQVFLVRPLSSILRSN